MILVYKTSIKNKSEVQKITPILNSVLENEKWNFDLNDSDNILRFVTNQNVTNNLTTALLLQGFSCEELQ